MTARHLSQGCSRLLGFVPAVFPILALPPRVIGQSQPLSLAYQLTHSINADPALTADGRRMVYISVVNAALSSLAALGRNLRHQ
jgi:hypothetical protein